MSGPESNWGAWLGKAENDLLNMENNLAAAKVPWDTICFHAQQAAEKLLKAFLVYKEKAPPRTHDLIAILSECIRFAPSLRQLEHDCQRLTYYAVGTRYPDDLYEPTEAEAREMAGASRRVREAILSRLPPQGLK